jgi:hypothetical protein
MLTTQLHLALGLRMSGAIPIIPLHALMERIGKTLVYFRLFTFKPYMFGTFPSSQGNTIHIKLQVLYIIITHDTNNNTLIFTMSVFLILIHFFRSVTLYYTRFL